MDKGRFVIRDSVNENGDDIPNVLLMYPAFNFVVYIITLASIWGTENNQFLRSDKLFGD